MFFKVEIFLNARNVLNWKGISRTNVFLVYFNIPAKLFLEFSIFYILLCQNLVKRLKY